MNRARLIVRGVILVLAIFLLIDLNRKADDAVGRVVKFKSQTLNKIKSDSLDSQQKLDMLVDETSAFSRQINEDSPQVRDHVRYLIGLMGLLVAFELVFFVARKKRPGE